MIKLCIHFLLFSVALSAQKADPPQKTTPVPDIYHQFQQPPPTAAPWVFWYWMKAAYSREGITADLEAMKEAGIAGAYLAPIKPKTDPPLLEPVIETLTPAWWDIIRFTFEEADRLGLQIGMLPNDGFATAGGKWITPELSMQKVVWTSTHVKGGASFNDTLATPSANWGYYKDIAVLAYPSQKGENMSTDVIVPKVTTSLPGKEDAQFLAVKGSRGSFESRENCWIQYTFDRPFTCHNITIHVGRFNYQAERLIIQVSNDGKDFTSITRLEPPRAGWFDWDEDVTHDIEPVTARYFRFVYDIKGSEPGAEDLDAAKWKQSLKLSGIWLSGAPRIHQFEGKNASVWRISRATSSKEVPVTDCVPLNKIINISRYLDASGRLVWKVPAGDWTVLRVGHTTSGHQNETAGAGKGLECDKFNPRALKFQFDQWFGEAVRVAGPELAKRVLTTFHIDSWECGSQNWSPVFADEFKRRRGYDLVNYLPAMAGIPVQSAAVSEKFLHDVRTTIAELVEDSCYKTLKSLAHEKGCVFTAECTAPVMAGDGMLHFKDVDIPMGEFWLRSPTHDKPNDMLDAISAAHIYGKPVIQAEAFTEIRMTWDEHPGILKTLQDRNYALGINKLVYHIYVHNPWMDRRPGMTLDPIGLYFQRDQTWWKPGKAWVDYARRCQALLQLGRPVADIAVFTGEEIPRRAVLPERLVATLPGIFGAARVKSEKERMANTGQPLRVMPKGVTNSANIADPAKWVDPLRGYAYDSFNPDALLNLAKVNKGRIVLPGGASYGVLVLPAPSQMTPESGHLSDAVTHKLNTLKAAGAKIIINKFAGESFDSFGIQRDLIARDAAGVYAKDIAWTHRSGNGFDIYFVSNQQDSLRRIDLSLRVSGREPELFDAVTGTINTANEWKIEKGRTLLPLKLDPGASVFVVLRKPAVTASVQKGTNWKELKTKQPIDGPWSVKFDTASGGPVLPVVFNTLQDWSKNPEAGIRYYSGTAVYNKTFTYQPSGNAPKQVWLDLGHIANIAEVIVNGRNCGVIWTAPFRADITGALKNGVNKLEIRITNTWANRLIGDESLPKEQRITTTTAPFQLSLSGSPLLEAGLLGPVKLETE